MLWYLMKTWAGGEEALAEEIRRTVPPYMYREAFVIYNERNWRHQGRSVLHEEPLFKGCVFLTCGETEPLFRRMEQVPALLRLMAGGYLTMFPLRKQDADFLETISGTDHVVRISYVLREAGNGEVYRIAGPLEYLLDGIEKIRFSSRIAKTRRELWGEELVLPLGFVVNEDLSQNVRYKGLPVSMEMPEHYTLLEIGKDETGRNVYRAGERIAAPPQAESGYPEPGIALASKEQGRLTAAV